jgi:uncharacterized protein (TIGR01777 family)
LLQIVVAGATGFIGRPLCAALCEAGHSVVALARDPAKASGKFPGGTRILAWDLQRPGEWHRAVGESDAVVNLAGESVAAQRWTAAFKQRLVSSRIETTRAIVAAIRAAERPGMCLINASAVGYYGDRGDAIVTEQTPPANTFLGQLSVDWEARALEAEQAGARVVLLRIGIVLGEGGGALEKMVTPFRLFVGGPLGSGRQWFPWIHRDDVVGMIVWALENRQARGPLNVTAPNPVTMGEFARVLGRVLHRPAFVPAPGFALKLLLGEFAGSLLTGQRAIPEAAQRLGYQWRYPELEAALRAIFPAR